MNIGDGLLLKLENGKPKLIVLSHADVEKNAAKQASIKPRAAKILSPRQPCCMEEVPEQERTPQQVTGSHREVKGRAAGASTSSNSNKTTAERRSSSLTSSKTHHKDRSIKSVTRRRDGVMSNKHKLSTTAGPPGANGKAAQPVNVGTRGGGKTGLKQTGVDAGLKDNLVCLTREQLQQILNAVKNPINEQNGVEEQAAHGKDDQTDPKSDSVAEEGREIREEDEGGGEELEDKGRGTDANRSTQEKDKGVSRSLFSWLEERESDSRAIIDAKKAQWKRELDEQVALKQQRSAPSRLQVEEYAESVLSVQSSVSHREQHAAIRSSLKLGEVTPMEESLSADRREEQRRRWLEELDRQREEAAQRRKLEKLLKNQPEDHDRWAAHFDSLQRRRLVRTPAATSAPPPGRLNGSERGDWDPSSSLSLVWEATSSCGAESVTGARVDSTNGFPPRTSYLRTMTSLLDPAQMEERERRRIKQLEQQRAIEAQMEERRRQREQEEAKRRQEEEEEERRLTQEREKLQKLYDLETDRKKPKEEVVHQAELPEKSLCNSRQEETTESSITGQSRDLEKTSSSTSSYKDTAVQTEETTPLILQLSDAAALPPPPPPNSRSRAGRTGKENVCLPAGDPYEAFARTDRSCRDKKRPEWNTNRPSRQFVPASERYPVALQRNRQENRLKRQAELLALQERTRQARTEPPPQNHEPRPGPNTQSSGSVRKVETGSGANNDPTAISSDRGRSPPVPTIKPKVQSQQASRSSPVLEFIPYIRTDEVFNLNPLESTGTPPPQTHCGAPPESSASRPASSHQDRLLHPELLRNTHTHRQQEILRGLAQLRQGLLQKQKELEMDLNPLWNRHDNERRLPTAKHNKT